MRIPRLGPVTEDDAERYEVREHVTPGETTDGDTPYARRTGNVGAL